MTDKISLRKLRLNDIDSLMELFVNKDVIAGIGLDKKVGEITKKFEMDKIEKAAFRKFLDLVNQQVELAFAGPGIYHVYADFSYDDSSLSANF